MGRDCRQKLQSNARVPTDGAQMARRLDMPRSCPKRRKFPAFGLRLASGRLGESWFAAMTWEELRDLLVGLSDETRVASAHGMDTVALNLVPVAWFISMKFSNALNIGIYEGDDHRLVGIEQIPLPELTPSFVRQRVEEAMAEQVRGMLDPEIVEMFRRQLERNSNKHIDRDLG